MTKNYSLDEKSVIWLSTFDFITYKKEQQLIELFGSAGEVYSDFEKKKNEIVELLGEDAYSKMLYSKTESFLKTYLKGLDSQNIHVITCFSQDYPSLLSHVDCPPYILYFKGDISLLKTDCIAIVGTRKPTAYGRNVTDMFSRSLAHNGLTIVSGLAYGVDSVAHEACLKTGGKTIAILGGGFNHIYPATNCSLAKEIEEKGLLISEYKPSFAPANYTFVMRNRIIAGISKSVLITEAGEKSGSLQTKEYALEMGREIFVVPGNITSPESFGTNRLIKSCQGACTYDVEDILRHYDIASRKPCCGKKTQIQLSVNETLILSILDHGETAYEVLQEKTKLEPKILNSCLTSLQIRGIIRKLPGNLYSL